MKNKMKTAWVTGGSSGIGFELSKRLLKDKYQVCIFAHAGIETAIVSLQKHSPAVCGFEIDVRDEHILETKFAEAAAAFGSPDLLINCAGVAVSKSFEDLSTEEFTLQIDINLVGSRHVARAALPHLKQATQQGKSPKLVLIASVAGLVGCYGFTAYGASKYGVVGLAEALRMELRHLGIDVAVVCPPEVETPMLAKDRQEGSPVTTALREIVGTLPVEKAGKAIYDGIQSSQFMIIPSTQARMLTKISRLLPDVYRNQIDKQLDKIISRLQAS